MTLFDTIGKELGRAELAACRALGVIVGFTHRTEPAVPIYVEVGDLTGGTEQVQARRMVEVGEMLIYVPVQNPAFSGVSGFSGTYAITASTGAAKPSVITAGDRFEHPLGSGRYFWVKQDGVKPVHNGWTYEVVIREERALTLGQRS